MTLLSSEIQYIAAKFRLDENDLENVRLIGEYIVPDLEEILDSFYGWMSEQAFYKQYFFNQEVVNHIKAKQVDYWIDFFKAEISDPYIAKRKKLGEVHAQIGLDIELYHQATGVIQKLFQEVLGRKGFRSEGAIWSLMRYMNWDFSMVCDAEANANTEMLERMLTEQAKVLEEMSTPITVLWDGILLLPLIGKISSKRANHILDEVLLAIQKNSSKVLILDLGGITDLNTGTARHFIRIAKAAQLMGCTCSLTGIKPETAQILVELDLDIEQLQTQNSLVASLEKAMEQLGHKLIIK